MKCLNECGKEVVSKGTKPAKYCSDACRKAYKRSESKRTQQTDTEQTDKIKIVSNPGKLLPIEQSPYTSSQPEQINQNEPNKLDKIIISSIFGKPTNFGQPNCECKQCESNRNTGNRHTLNHGAWKSFKELASGELNRVALPGDVDYAGVAV